MAAPVKEGGLCSQIWNSTLKGGAAAAFWAFAARATATRCSGESSGLLGAAPAMSQGEDNSWRSLGAAAVSACVWAFFCAVAALLVLAAARPSFGSSARRRTLNRRLAGVLLASTARLAAAGPANASVAPFSDDISRTQRKLTGYVMDDSNIRTAVAAWIDDASYLASPTPAEAHYGHISTWETSGVTDMSYLFCGWRDWMEGESQYDYCLLTMMAFDEDIGGWDTSGVTRMDWMFYGASSFNQNIPYMFVTPEVSHAPMSSLKDADKKHLSS